MAQSTTTTHGVFLPNVWAKDVYESLKKNLPLADTVNRFDSDVQRMGQTVEVPVVAGLTANNVASGASVTFEADTEVKKTITINHRGVAAFSLDNIVDVQANYDMRKIYTDEATYAVADLVEQEIVTQIDAATTSAGGSHLIAAAAAGLTDAKIRTAKQVLDEAKVPLRDRYLIVSPNGLNDILGENRFTSVDFVGTGNGGFVVVQGQPMNLYGMRVYMTQNLASTVAYAYQKQAVGLAMQRTPQVWVERNVTTLAHDVAVWNLFGCDWIRDTAAVEIAHT